METKTRENEVIEFLQSNTKTHFLQSPEWAKIKEQWKNEFIVVRNSNNQITGTMSILIRKTPIFNMSIMYAPRGFVCDINDKQTLEKLTNEVKKVAKRNKAFIFRMDPDVSNDNEDFKKILKELGYKLKKNIKNIDDVIQPKYVIRLDLQNKTEEELLQSFHNKTRYNIKLATKKGVTIREGTKADLSIFYDIMKKTGTRDNFFIRDISYFEKIYDAMYPKYTKLLIAEYNNIPIAATMPILYGNKVWYLYGGSSNEYRNLMPNYLIQWKMIQWALQNNCTVYDFRGVSGFKDINSPQYGVYRFKKGFNGELIEFIDEPYIVFNPVINWIWNIAVPCYKQLLHIKNKIFHLS
ncbi:MAG: peptidoglycan bridge formation glycyltransferase FemA/FemB family protein [Clostridia bacterium]|nr:peptidoglycan bridge formation glycyltransferase FemA/FemB family protein [Clostridia bacterium]